MEAEEPVPPTVLSSEELKRTDRQRTIIGLETMLKLNQSNILITPLNGPNAELAKNLVLAGANVSIYDQQVINSDDFETNFLVAYDDLGKKRGSVVLGRLKEMNPSAKNHEIQDNLLEKLEKDRQFFKKFTFLITSTLDFELAAKWYALSLEVGVPYYNLVNCGKYAWSVISLGKDYQYIKKPVTVMRYGADGKALQSGPKQSDIDRTIHPIPFADLFDQHEKEPRDLYRAILMLKHAQQQGWKYDPFSQTPQNNQVLNKIVTFAVTKWGPEKKSLFENIVRQYGIDFCPVYSVLGSVISQEIIKVLSANQEPGVNWFLYDSEECYGVIHRVERQKKAVTETVRVEAGDGK